MCLALDKRKEYWPDLISSFKRENVDVSLFVCGDGKDESLIYNQIDEENPDCSNWIYGVSHLKRHHHRALTAHKGMIETAIKNDWSSVLMLEDDCYARTNFSRILNNIKIPDDWQLIYLGYWHGNEWDEWNTAIEDAPPEVVEVKPGFSIGGWHSVVVRDTVYPFILNCPHVNPLDTLISQHRQYFKSYMITPKLTGIRSIHSFTEGVVIQRKELE